MTTRQLLWGMMWRGAVWGMTLGIIFGALYLVSLGILDAIKFHSDILSKAFTSAIFGAIPGGIIGAFLGIGGGILAGALTRIYFFLFSDMETYYVAVGMVSVIFATIIGWNIFYFMVELNAAMSSGAKNLFPTTTQIIEIAVVPTLLVGLCAMVASQMLARWYERESAKGIAQNVSPN